MKKSTWLKRGGFTLIELLVVIAIIGLLSSVVFASLNSARVKARDARRISDLKQIQIALELYYDKNGVYPLNSDAACGGWDGSGTDAEDGAGGSGQFIQPLVSDGFFSGGVPRDPQGGACKYQYMRRASGAGYQIAIDLENDLPAGAHPVCPAENASLYCVQVGAYP